MGSDPGAPYDVFISYSHDDAEIATAIDVALRLSGLRVFLDRRDIKLGESLVTRVFDGIAAAAAQLVLVSKSSVASGWVAQEIAAGRSRAISGEYRTIPVRVDEAEVPAALAHLKYLDLVEWLEDRTFRRGISELLEALGVEAPRLDEADIQWCLRHMSELLAFSLDLREARGYVLGSGGERLGASARPTGSLGLKFLMNDFDVASQVTLADRAPLDDLPLKSDGLMNGLRFMQLWLADTADEDPGDGVLLLQKTVDDCLRHLKEQGFRVGGYVISEQALLAQDLHLELNPLCEALRQIMDRAIRLGVPAARGASASSSP